MQYLSQASDQGVASAQFNLATVLRQGLGGVPVDKARGRQLLEKAAAQGHAKAQFNLSQIYQLGSEVATNYRLAKDLLEVSAAQGHPAAMFNLGACYVNGHGVAVNLLKAREIWERAALTSPTARTHLSMLTRRMAIECPLVGHRVVIEGTNMATLNGSMGEATGYDPGTSEPGVRIGRYSVLLDSGETFRIKGCNLRRVIRAPQADSVRGIG